jgi:hypothetical protein
MESFLGHLGLPRFFPARLWARQNSRTSVVQVKLVGCTLGASRKACVQLSIYLLQGCSTSSFCDRLPSDVYSTFCSPELELDPHKEKKHGDSTQYPVQSESCAVKCRTLEVDSIFMRYWRIQVYRWHILNPSLLLIMAVHISLSCVPTTGDSGFIEYRYGTHERCSNYLWTNDIIICSILEIPTPDWNTNYY